MPLKPSSAACAAPLSSRPVSLTIATSPACSCANSMYYPCRAYCPSKLGSMGPVPGAIEAGKPPITAWLATTITLRGRMASHDKNVAPDLAAIPPLMEWIEQRCQEAGLASELTFKLMLAIEEAATNVVSYAFAEVPPPHRFRVRLDIDDKRCAAELADNGRPFDPSAAPPPDLTAALEEREAGGLGIHLLRNMADRVEYRREAGENRLRIETARG